MKRIIAALTALGVGLVFLIPTILQAEGGTDQNIIWTKGHYYYAPGGKKKVHCDGTGELTCRIRTYKMLAYLPEEIEGYSGQDGDNYYFDAIETLDGEMVNAVGGEETIAIPIALWPEE